MPETDDGVRGDREDGDGHENGDILGDGNRESGPSGNKMTSFEDVEVDERDSDIGRSDILLSPPVSEDEDDGIHLTMVWSSRKLT